MTISVMSDLHCYGSDLPGQFNVEKLKKADVLVIAGDLAVYDTRRLVFDKIKNEVKDKFSKIIVVYGNHDFYTQKYYYYPNNDSEPSVEDNFVESVTETAEDGTDKVVDFICTPLWTPIKNHMLITTGLNDYNYIPDFSTKRCTELFWENVKWLEKQVKKSKKEGHKVVIVTHHLPRHELIADIHKTSQINEAFAVIDKKAEKKLAALKPDIWIHGHSHTVLDTTIDGIRYIRNPMGYEYRHRGYIEDTNFELNKIITI